MNTTTVARSKATAPAAELFIRRPDKTVTRFVRSQERAAAETTDWGDRNDEDFRVVAECAPYTASFNNLLEEQRPGENPRHLVSLVRERMRNEGIPMSTKTYNLLMKRVVRYSDGLIFALYDELKAEATKPASSVQPDLETFQLLFHACERAGEYHRTFLLYQQMRTMFHLVPSTATYNTLLGYCAVAHDVAQASFFMEEMIENHVERDANTFNCFMSTLVDSAPYAETLRVLYEMQNRGVRPSLRTYNTVLKAAHRNDDYDRAIQLFEEMKRKGVVPSVITYNLLLCLCVQRLEYVFGTGRYARVRRTREQQQQGRRALAELALTLLSEMSAMGVEANTFSYNRVLSVLLACRDSRVFSVHRAMTLLYEEDVARREEDSGDRRPRPPLPRAPWSSGDAVGTVNTTAEEGDPLASEDPQTELEAAMTAEDPQSADRMGAKGVHPHIETYNVMLDACLQFDYPEKGPVYYSNMRRYGLHVARRTLELLLRVCERLQDKEWAARLLHEDAEEAAVFIDTALFNRYLAVLVACNDSAVRDVFHEMELGINRYGTKVNAETYNIMLKYYLDRKHTNEGLQLFAQMKRLREQACRPTDETYILVMDLHEQLGDVDTPARMVLEDFVVEETVVQIGVYHRLLRLFASAKDKRIESVFAAMKSDAARGGRLPGPNVDCYAALMEYYVSCKRYKEVDTLFKELKASETLEPDSAVYGVVFRMLHEQDCHPAMLALFDDVRMNAVTLDVAMYNTLLEASLAAKEIDFVFVILNDMKTNAIPPSETTLATLVQSEEGRKVLAQAVARKLFFKPTSPLSL